MLKATEHWEKLIVICRRFKTRLVPLLREYKDAMVSAKFWEENPWNMNVMNAVWVLKI